MLVYRLILAISTPKINVENQRKRKKQHHIELEIKVHMLVQEEQRDHLQAHQDISDPRLEMPAIVRFCRYENQIIKLE